MKNRRAIAFFLFWSAAFALALVLLSLPDRALTEADRGCLSIVDVGAVARIEIARRAEGSVENIVLARTDGKWRMESPIIAEADEEAVKRLMDVVVFAEKGDILSRKDMSDLGRSLRDFGLASPRCSVTLFAEGMKETFSVGRETAAGDEVYANCAGGSSVFTLPVAVAAELTRPIVEFRRRKLFTFGVQDVVGIGLKDAGEPLTRLSKTDGQWRIADPIDAPADRQTVEEIIGALCSALVTDYALDAGAEYGIGDGEGFSIALRDAFGTVEKVVFGTADGSETVWAMTSEGALVHVRRDLFDWCRLRSKALEDTCVYPIDASQMTSLSVSRGFPAYVVSRQSVTAPWMMVSPVVAMADAKAVSSLVSNVLSLKSDDVLEGKSEGAVLVSVGAVTTNFPPRYVTASALSVNDRFEDLLDKTVVRYCKESIKRIVVKPAAGDGWNAAASDDVLSLVDAGIEAVRVDKIALGPDDFARCGFSSPAYTISLELNDSASSLKRMLVGSVAPNGGRYAMIGGLDAAFVLSAQVVSKLTKPAEILVEDE